MPKKSASPKSDSLKKLKHLDKEIDRHFGRLIDGEPPKVWYIRADRNHPLNEFVFEPKRFNIICAAPGIGKTSFIHTLIFDAMDLNKGLKVLEINCDTPSETIIERELSRQSGISCNTIHLKGSDQEGGFTQDQLDNLEVAKIEIQNIGDRYLFLGSNATFADAVEVIKHHRPNILIVDYVQIMDMGNGFSGMEKMAEFCRQCKNLKDTYDLCIIGISAATKDSFDRTTSLSSIRDSSELAFAPDDCIVINMLKGRDNVLEFRFEKRRNGNKNRKIYFEFDGELQTFSPLSEDQTTPSKTDEE